MKPNQKENPSTKLGAATLGMTLVVIIALLLVPTLSDVSATSYQGNSNSEISANSNASFVTVEMHISQSLVFKSANPNAIGLQLNPDLVSSWANQKSNAVVQAAIDVIMQNGAPYVQFTVQIYSPLGYSTSIQTLPSTLTAWSVPQALSAGTYWQIVEYLSGGQITSIYFAVNTSSGTSKSATITPPSGYKWINSNLCLCGGSGGETVTFTGGAGTMYYWSSLPLTSKGLPWLAATEESSNMQYGCMSGSGSYMISQSFGLSGACTN
jgi:hypothetical protein